ncbi:LamG domain-containing protein [Mariniflexile soesokkakense]|uniref:LamG domain-containing protein n=1 Tax=Mariniflexile soesokkakense TaxID=1343160 RepID=A0ABV0ADH3_9FLAO
MKNTTLKYLGLVFMAIITFGCQNLEQPEFSDFLYDGPVITLSTPSPNGATVVRSKDPIASITIKFQVEDDLGIANITVKLDDAEIANMNEFADSKLVIVDDLTKEVSTGNHTLTITATDTNNVVATQTTTFEKVDTPPYEPVFEGESFYMAFDGDFSEAISGNGATEVGAPGFATDAKVGSNAYAGATDSYLTFPTAGLLGNEFSASFWYKVNAAPTAGGILVIGPPDDGKAADKQNNRKSGFRFFREGNGTAQTFKLNVGNGTGDSWFDGGAAARIDPTVTTDWIHLAFTISGTECVVYINGQVVKQGTFAGVDWAGCDVMSIMSGVPRFTEWGHKSDLSYMDELRLFNKALTQDDVTRLVAHGSKTFNMPFNGSYIETNSKTDATVVGTPTFTTASKEGSNAYVGAVDAYLTFPTADLLGNEFSGTFWYNLNNPGTNRAGILTVSAPDLSSPLPTNGPGNLNFGFRLFREGGADQSIRLNVGNGTGRTTAVAARRLNNSSGWVHIAFTISQTKAMIYMDGVLEIETNLTGLDWTGCDIMSIMSGAPRYLIFNHKSDLSSMDALAFYNKVLSQTEIQALMN